MGMKGDLNGDGEVNDADHDKITEVIMTSKEPEEEEVGQGTLIPTMSLTRGLSPCEF